MGKMEASVRIEAPPQRVWELITDLEGAPERIEGIKSLEVLTDQPFGVGTRWRETRVMFGKDATEEMEITAIDEGSSYLTEAESCGCHYTCAVGVVPEGDGSVLSMSMDARPMTFFGKVMSAVMFPMMKGSMVKLLAKDLDDIKAAAEG